MREVVLGLGISLDGYIARPNGAVDFLFMPKDYSMAPFFASIDTRHHGPQDPRRRPANERRLTFSELVHDHLRLLAFPPARRARWSHLHSSIARRPRPSSCVSSRGRNIWHMGGGELAREFLKADLVDELHLGIVPVLLGEGIPLFPGGFPQRDFSLVANKTYSKGLIALEYKRARPRAKGKS